MRDHDEIAKEKTIINAELVIFKYLIVINKLLSINKKVIKIIEKHVISTTLFNRLWYLHHEARILCLYSLSNFLVFPWKYLVFVSHQIISILNGGLNMRFWSFKKLKLQDRVISKLSFSNNIKLSLLLGKNCKNS